MDSGWYYVSPDGRRSDRHTALELRELYKSGKLTADTRVWHEDLTGWTPLDETEIGDRGVTHPLRLKRKRTGATGISAGLAVAALVFAAAMLLRTADVPHSTEPFASGDGGQQASPSHRTIQEPQKPGLPREPLASEGGTRQANPLHQTAIGPQKPALPPDEAEFIRATLEARDAARKAPNDMALGGLRADRKNAVCRALADHRDITGWIGTIATLSSNSEGKGVLSIKLADNVAIKTWNNALSDIGDHTLLDPESPLFHTVAAMKRGDIVSFSGSFSPSDVDCVRESSITLSGSLRNPEFIFAFSAVAPALFGSTQ